MLAKIGGAVVTGVGLVALYCVAVVADLFMAASMALASDPRGRTR